VIRSAHVFPAILLISFAGCLPSPAAIPESYPVLASVKQVMEAITTPTSDVVWSVAIDPPETDADWEVLEANALALAESGTLLLMPGRAMDQGNWIVETRALVDASLLAAEAARGRDVEALLDAGDAIYDTCTSCHSSYLRMP
jgi:hypothetical protein